MMEQSPPLFPDLLDRHPPQSETDRFALWLLADSYRRGRPYSELRAITVMWDRPDSFIPPTTTPWTMNITHYYHHPVKRSKSCRECTRFSSRTVKREFASRADCVAFAERLLRRIARIPNVLLFVEPPITEPPITDHPITDHPITDHPITDHPLEDTDVRPHDAIE